MSELELTCPRCDYTQRGPDNIPYPDRTCPECGTHMQTILHFTAEEWEAIQEIVKNRKPLRAQPIFVEKPPDTLLGKDKE